MDLHQLNCQIILRIVFGEAPENPVLEIFSALPCPTHISTFLREVKCIKSVAQALGPCRKMLSGIVLAALGVRIMETLAIIMGSKSRVGGDNAYAIS